MLNVYICAPLSGNLKKNLQNAIAFLNTHLKSAVRLLSYRIFMPTFLMIMTLKKGSWQWMQI